VAHSFIPRRKDRKVKTAVSAFGVSGRRRMMKYYQNLHAAANFMLEFENCAERGSQVFDALDHVALINIILYNM